MVWNMISKTIREEILGQKELNSAMKAIQWNPSGSKHRFRIDGVKADTGNIYVAAVQHLGDGGAARPEIRHVEGTLILISN